VSPAITQLGSDEVVVIGGGLAGISAALELARAGAKVTLLESRGSLGGATWSVERDGLVFDNGQHVYLRCCTAYTSFVDRLNAGDMVAVPKRLNVPVLVSSGRGYSKSRLRRTALGLPAPLHLTGSLLAFPGLSWRDKAMLARAVMALRALPSLEDGGSQEAAERNIARQDPASQELDRLTFGEWLRAHGQSQEAIGDLWDLVVRSTCNLSVEEVSATLGAMVVKTGLLEDPQAADIGWSKVPLGKLHGELPASVLEGLGAEIILRCPVRSLETDRAGHFTIRTPRGSIQTASVVLAVGHESASALLEGTFPEAKAWQRLGRSPIVNVHVVYPLRVMEEEVVVSLDPYLQWVFDRTEACGLGSAGPDGPQYLSISLSAARDQAAMPHRVLLGQVISKLEEAFPRARGQKPTCAFVVTEKAATFAGVPGTARLRPFAGSLPDKALAGLALAGAWCNTGWPATMESAVRSGLTAARAILAPASRVTEASGASLDLSEAVA